jgi:hypothetical protein
MHRDRARVPGVGRLGCSLLAFLLTLPSACGAVDSEKTKYEAAMRHLGRQIRAEEITKGTFRKLTVGDSKDQVLRQLDAMGVEFVYPDLANRAEVGNSEDLGALRSADGIIVGAGSVVVEFEDDEVVRVLVAPIHPRWKDLLESAQTRDQVFEALRTMLDENGGLTVRSLAPDADYVKVRAPGRTGSRLLGRYDEWKASFSDSEGYWSLKMHFSEDRLSKIEVWHSPVEVP